MITFTCRMDANPDLAWVAEHAWRNFDLGMVNHLRSTDRSHLCRLLWRGVDMRTIEPILEAEFDEFLADLIDLHLRVFNCDCSDPMIEAIQFGW